MRNVNIRADIAQRGVHRVIDVGVLAAECQPHLRFLVNARCHEAHALVERWRSGGFQNIALFDGDRLEEGKVVAVWSEKGKAMVLHRENDLHHTLFLTNRCNSYCLMCSQPPTSSVSFQSRCGYWPRTSSVISTTVRSCNTALFLRSLAKASHGSSTIPYEA